MKKAIIIKYGLTFLMIGSAWALWFSIARAVTVADSSTWLVPIFWASLFFVSTSLAFVLVESIGWLRLAVALSFLGTFLFAFHWTGILAILLAFLLSYVALVRIKKDLLLNIKVDLRKSLDAGKSFVIIALMIVITAQYYSQVKSLDVKKIIPQFNFSGKSNQLISQVLSASNPQFRQIQQDDLTVDAFIWESQKKQLESLADQGVSTSVSGLALENNRQEIIEEGRKAFSEMTGKKIAGNEKISDVFSEVVNQKIENYFRPRAVDEADLPIIPFIMALVLFFTIVPLGSFISRFLVYLVFGIFTLLVRAEVVKIAKVMMEVERIRED